MYCSRQCWLDERKAKAEAKRLAKSCCTDRSCYLHYETQRCGHCKRVKLLEKYTPSDRGITGSWCKPCHAAYARGDAAPAAMHEPQQCLQCDEWYVPKNLYEKRDRPSKYCSEECNQAAKSARRTAELVASKPDLTCQYCGNPIPRESLRNQLFCSRECARKADRLRRSLRERVRMEVRTSSHLFAEICIRDEWICGLCHKPVDRTLQHPDPMCASIDHITQVHQGGTNDPANLRLTHLVCNQCRPRKRTDPDATEFLRVGRWL